MHALIRALRHYVPARPRRLLELTQGYNSLPPARHTQVRLLGICFQAGAPGPTVWIVLAGPGAPAVHQQCLRGGGPLGPE